MRSKQTLLKLTFVSVVIFLSYAILQYAFAVGAGATNNGGWIAVVQQGALENCETLIMTGVFKHFVLKTAVFVRVFIL